MLEIKNLYKKYKKEYVLKDININIEKNSSLALVGESGAGKTTLSKIILNMEKQTKGKITIKEKGINVVFQDYRSSVNPIFKIKEIIKEPFWLKNRKLDEDCLEDLLQTFSLPLNIMEKYPHELSGGQLQRVCILRAILAKPTFLILDEAFSALDIYTKTKIVSYLKNLKKEENLTLLLITHDLQVATSLCENIKILYKGNIIETLKTKELKNAKNSYSKALIDSVIRLEI